MMGWWSVERVTALWIFAVIITQCGVATSSQTQFNVNPAQPRMRDEIANAGHSVAGGGMQVDDKEGIQLNTAVAPADCNEDTHHIESAISRQRMSSFLAADIFPRDATMHSDWNKANHTGDDIKPDAVALNGPSFMMGNELSTLKGLNDGSRQVIANSRQSGKQRRAVAVIDDDPTITALLQNNKNSVGVRSTTDTSYHSQPHAEPIRISSMAPTDGASSLPTPFVAEINAINSTAMSISEDNEFPTTSTIIPEWSDFTTAEFSTANLTELPCLPEDEGISCTIDHRVKCVGNVDYCNDTMEQYMNMMHEYIKPSPPEWILIFAHAVVFFMGLVRNIYN